MKFRKKPIEVEAILTKVALDYAAHYWGKLPKWLSDAYETGKVFFGDTYVVVHSLEGDMRAERNDWIIQGVAGELYPCKPDIFKKTYDTLAND